MFKFKVSNIFEALALSQKWATHTVSLLDSRSKDSDMELPVAGKDSVLQRYYFDDIEPNDELVDPNDESLKMATREQIEDILELTALLKPTDRLLVHCHVGISRSTAVAIGVLCQHKFSPKIAVKSVFLKRPFASPNEHILGLFDEILALDGKLVPACIEVQRLLKQMKINNHQVM